MASKAELREAVERWQKHCETVQQATVVNTAETEREKLARIRRVRSDYAAFVDYYFPHYTVNPETGTDALRAVPYQGGEQGAERTQPESGVQMASRRGKVHTSGYFHTHVAEMSGNAPD